MDKNKKKRRSHKQKVMDKAKEIGRKFRAKLEKKAEQEQAQEQEKWMTPRDYTKENTGSEDTRTYEFCDYTGTEQECWAFIKANPNLDYIGSAPYLYCRDTFRITFWKEKEV
jgi:hypothetical protein